MEKATGTDAVKPFPGPQEVNRQSVGPRRWLRSMIKLMQWEKLLYVNYLCNLA